MTRAEPAASNTVEALIKAGSSPILFPLFKIEDTGTGLPGSAYKAIIFTSGNAIEILSRRKWHPANPAIDVFCVGAKTREAAERLGFENVFSTEGDAWKLSEYLLERYSGTDVKLLYPAGVKRAFDMVKALGPGKIKVELVEIYDLVQIVLERNQLNETLKEIKNGIVFLYSRKTAIHVCETLFGNGVSHDAEGLTAIAISSKTADVVLKYPWQDVYVADEPTETSMIKKLGDLSFT